MLFNSYVFILGFFPLSLLLYFGLNHVKKEKAAQIVLILMSLCFYAYFHVWYLPILLGSIAVNFVLSKLMITREKYAKILLFAGILGNVSVIFYFKYFGFFLENVNLFRQNPISLPQILMPLGISFFTFQQISYLVDSYRGETKEYGWTEYALFVCFFPQLIAGPIVFHEEMIAQFRDPQRKKINQENLASGLHLFAIGLAKKVLLADCLAKGVDWGYANSDGLSGMTLVLLAVFYSFQLYFDFSGYCDMACGIARCFQFELPVNFLSPYQADSIADFWKRWHITLNRFLTKYVYIPLGGNRKGTVRTYLHILIVFLISGIWHGANWTFIFWGMLHGVASVLHRIWGKLWEKLLRPLRVGITYLFVTLAWIPFRADDLRQAFAIYGGIFRRPSLEFTEEFYRAFGMLELSYLEEHLSVLRKMAEVFPMWQMGLLLFFSVVLIFCCPNVHEKTFRPTVGNALTTVVLLLWSVLSLSEVSSFLYFNF